MIELPGVRFGTKGLPDWREKANDDVDDDEEVNTSSDLLALLGFDPLDLEEG